MAAGADVNAKDFTYHTPLSLAAIGGFADVIDVLLAAGAVVNSPRIRGMTPLHLAAKSGDVRSINSLLAAGADPTSCENEQYFVLHCAILSGQIEAVKLLLRHNAVLWDREWHFDRLLYAEQYMSMGYNDRDERLPALRVIFHTVCVLALL